MIILFLFSPVIDGVLDPQEGWMAGAGNPDTTAFKGADLDSLYYAASGGTLYLAIKTGNRANWSLSYGFALDVDRTQNSGCTDTVDSWQRKIVFPNEAPDYFLPDYEVYFYWNEDSARITSAGLNKWIGSSDTLWIWNLCPFNYAWSGDTLTGLQVLEFAIPLDTIGNPTKVLVSTWIAGATEGSSAVDALPPASSIDPFDTAKEWTDTDTSSTYITVNISGIPRVRHEVPLKDGIYNVMGRKAAEGTPGVYFVIEEGKVKKTLLVR
ncbi:hypothetical protein DRQ16_00445 [bacterium]|nr:MAG: hypothetical protein DRQ16_00445 [bacterium]